MKFTELSSRLNKNFKEVLVVVLSDLCTERHEAGGSERAGMRYKMRTSWCGSYQSQMTTAREDSVQPSSSAVRVFCCLCLFVMSCGECGQDSWLACNH